MYKSRIAQFAGIITATLATAALGASSAAALNPNGPVPVPIKKPIPRPFPIGACFSISATALPNAGFFNVEQINGQCFVPGTVAEVSVYDGYDGYDQTQEVTVAANGTFTLKLEPAPNPLLGSYDVTAVDPIGPSWISPSTSVLVP